MTARVLRVGRSDEVGRAVAYLSTVEGASLLANNLRDPEGLACQHSPTRTVDRRPRVGTPVGRLTSTTPMKRSVIDT
jgi:hypothetical protein